MKGFWLKLILTVVIFAALFGYVFYTVQSGVQ